MRTAIKKYFIIIFVTNVNVKKAACFVKKRQYYKSEGFNPDIFFISLERWE